MTNLFQEGIFSKDGNKFFIDDSINYLIAERKNPTPTKSKHFILAKTQGKEYYISSMYETDKEDQYNADYRGVKYLLTFSPGKVEIKKRGSKRP